MKCSDVWWDFFVGGGWLLNQTFRLISKPTAGGLDGGFAI